MAHTRVSKRLRGRVRVLPQVAVVMLILWPPGAGHSAYAQIRTDEEVIFFPSFGARLPGEAAWRLEIRGWIFEPEMDSLVRAATLDVFRGFLDLDPDSTSTQLFEARARMFLVDNERGKRITVRLGKRRFELPESAPDGHFRGTLHLPSDEVNSVVGRVSRPDILLRSVIGATSCTSPRNVPNPVCPDPPG